MRKVHSQTASSISCVRTWCFEASIAIWLRQMCTNWICYWSITAKGTLANRIEHTLGSHMMFGLFCPYFTCRMVDNCGNSVCIQHIKYLSDSLQWRRLTNNTSPTTFWLEEIDPLERCDFQIVMDWKPPIPYERTVRINNPWQSLTSSKKWKIL